MIIFVSEIWKKFASRLIICQITQTAEHFAQDEKSHDQSEGAPFQNIKLCHTVCDMTWLDSRMKKGNHYQTKLVVGG